VQTDVIKRRFLRRELAIAVICAALSGTAWAREAPAPVVEASDSVAAAKSLESRLVRIERLLENQTLVEMATRLDSLQQEVDRLLGKLDEQNHELEGLKKRQRDLYLDVDNRLRQLEEARAAAAAAPAVPTVGGLVPAPMPVTAPPALSTPSVEPADPAVERAAYERAFELLKQGRYDLAVAAFKAFVETYPHGQYADNAQYWLGEANYVQRNFQAAAAEFGKVVDGFPNSDKRPDAMLKLGYTQQELGQNDKARATLSSVVSSYPNSTAARLATKRLQDLKTSP
jgi:tol-pal system protein YbgF